MFKGQLLVDLCVGMDLGVIYDGLNLYSFNLKKTIMTNKV